MPSARSRQTKRPSPIRVGESLTTHRGSRTAHHPKNRIDPFEQCPSRALLGPQTPTRGAARCRVTENAGRAECSDAQTRLLEKIGGGAPSRKPVRRILHACPPTQGKGRAPTHRTNAHWAFVSMPILPPPARLSSKFFERLLTRSSVFDEMHETAGRTSEISGKRLDRKSVV
jgi:hypothetical protein